MKMTQEDIRRRTDNWVYHTDTKEYRTVVIKVSMSNFIDLYVVTGKFILSNSEFGHLIVEIVKDTAGEKKNRVLGLPGKIWVTGAGPRINWPHAPSRESW